MRLLVHNPGNIWGLGSISCWIWDISTPGINPDLLKCPFAFGFLTLRAGLASPFAPVHGSEELRAVMGIKDSAFGLNRAVKRPWAQFSVTKSPHLHPIKVWCIFWLCVSFCTQTEQKEQKNANQPHPWATGTGSALLWGSVTPESPVGHLLGLGLLGLFGLLGLLELLGLLGRTISGGSCGVSSTLSFSVFLH